MIQYYYCSVPNCKNTTVKSPGKLFIKVPNDIIRRNKWLELARCDSNSYSLKTTLHFCEDHFNLEQDMENYIQYKIMGSVKRIRMKPSTIPSRFDFNLDRKHRLPSLHCSHTAFTKRRRATSVQDAKKTLMPDEPSTSHESDSPVVEYILESKADKAVQEKILSVENKCFQVNLTKPYRSKATKHNSKNISKTTSPIYFGKTVGTSPFKKIINYKLMQSKIALKGKQKFSLGFKEKSDIEISQTQSLAGSTTHDSSPIKSKSSDSLPDGLQKENKKSNLFNMTSKIKRKPQLHVGICRELYFMINIIEKLTEIREQDILLCLTKIRLNRNFSQLSDDFGLSLSYASKIFLKTLPRIAQALAPFIGHFSAKSTKINLPIAFRHKYYKVQCIIHCLEIEVQKPSKAIYQALTWSEYKNTNTIKYLVACTPDGLVSFVSAGYCGRITDVSLLEHSNFLNSLEPGACILADRGFKHTETYLNQRNICLMRPPSLATGTKLTKAEARLTKQIASLRIHLERVIRRIREFRILKLHSVINVNLIPALDDCMKTACALINLQDAIIK